MLTRPASSTPRAGDPPSNRQRCVLTSLTCITPRAGGTPKCRRGFVLARAIYFSPRSGPSRSCQCHCWPVSPWSPGPLPQAPGTHTVCVPAGQASRRKIVPTRPVKGTPRAGDPPRNRVRCVLASLTYITPQAGGTPRCLRRFVPASVIYPSVRAGLRRSSRSRCVHTSRTRCMPVVIYQGAVRPVRFTILRQHIAIQHFYVIVDVAFCKLEHHRAVILKPIWSADRVVHADLARLRATH